MVAAAEKLSLTIRLSMSQEGMLRIRHELTNDADEPYELDALNVTLPAGQAAEEVLDLTGRWNRE